MEIIKGTSSHRVNGFALDKSLDTFPCPDEMDSKDSLSKASHVHSVAQSALTAASDNVDESSVGAREVYGFAINFFRADRVHFLGHWRSGSRPALLFAFSCCLSSIEQVKHEAERRQTMIISC